MVDTKPETPATLQVSHDVDQSHDVPLKPEQGGDDALLRAQGHETVMRRDFNLISALALAFGVTDSWVAFVSIFGQNLRFGGPAVAVFTVIIAWAVQWIMTLGLAELGSAFPTAGGQYHFVFIVAPPKTRRFSAFITGWMSILGWWCATCSTISLASNSTLGLIQFLHPDFIILQWHIYSFYVAFIIVTIIPLFIFHRGIPLLTSTILFLTIAVFFIWLIVPLAMKPPTHRPEYIVQSFQGLSGWSPGPSWLLGVLNSMYCFGATDGVIHISEEMKHPNAKIPQIMNLTMLVGIITTLPLSIAFICCIKDIDAVINAPWPAIELVYQATGSTAATVGLTVLLITVFAGAAPLQWITCGRLAWALARDRGTPFPDFFDNVSPVYNFPVRATLAAVVFSSLYGLIYFGSTTAFSSIIATAILLLNLSFAIPQAITVVQGRRKVLPKRVFDLGAFGTFCNIFTPIFITFLGVLTCLPSQLPATVENMNYAAPILVGLFTLLCLFWLWIGNNFEGPKIDWDLLYQAQEEVCVSGR